jgi:hypothetical protein
MERPFRLDVCSYAPLIIGGTWTMTLKIAVVQTCPGRFCGFPVNPGQPEQWGRGAGRGLGGDHGLTISPNEVRSLHVNLTVVIRSIATWRKKPPARARRIQTAQHERNGPPDRCRSSGFRIVHRAGYVRACDI